MKPTRRTQPYRSGKPRPPGTTLASMLAGKPKFGPNPQDAKRRLRKARGSAQTSSGVQNYGHLKPVKPVKPYHPGKLHQPTPMHPGFTLPGEQHQPVRARRKHR